jgi:CBS domain-containing protein
MKNKFSNTRLSYFFTPRIHGNVLAWVKPASAAERGQRVNENILRWEDDGGPVFEIGNSFPQVAEHQLRRFPVVDYDNKIVGMIAQADVALRVDQPEKTSEMVKEISKNEFLTKDSPGG